MSRPGIGLFLALVSLAGGCSFLFDSVEPGVDSDGGNPDAAAAVGDYYISPTGSDSDDGLTPETAFATWNHALGELAPGETLVAMDGVYDASNSGYPVIDCARGSNCGGGTCDDGAVGSELRIVAQHDRQAWIQVTGDWQEPAMTIRDCSSWSIHGLRMSGADIDNAQIDDGRYVMLVDNSRNITLTDLLLHETNRFEFGTLLQVKDSRQVVIEKLEGYLFHLTAVEIEDSENVELRSSVLYGEGHAKIPGGATGDSECADRGNRGLRFYGAINSSADNVVVEEVCDGIEVAPHDQQSESRNVAVSGSLVRDARDAAFYVRSTCHNACVGDVCPPSCDPNNVNRDTRIHNSLAYSAQEGIRLHGMEDAVLENFTAAECDIGLDIQLGHPENVTGMPSVQVHHSLVVGGGGGVSANADFDVMLSWINFFGQGKPVFELMGTGITQEDIGTIDPNLGSCLAYLPPDSDMRDADGVGGHVGAHIIDRTSRGGATVEGPLWGDDGSFPCGAEVDSTIQQCKSVHQRFFVGSPGCALP